MIQKTKSILTLIALPPYCGGLKPRLQDLISTLEKAGYTLSAPAHWLDDTKDEAVDLSLLGAPPHKNWLEGVIGNTPLDFIWQIDDERTPRRKKLLLADMDSTMIHQECLDELAAAIGLKEQVAAITEQAMRGELDFKNALRARVALLKDLPISALAETAKSLTLMEGAATLIATQKAHGGACYLVSGGFRFFTRLIADHLGFDGEQGNDFIIESDRLTGCVQEPILDKDSKLQALHTYAAQHQLSLSETLTVGDGANDLPMLQAAALGVAYRAKPAVAAAAQASIRYGNLKALLYGQGFHKNEWIVRDELTKV